MMLKVLHQFWNLGPMVCVMISDRERRGLAIQVRDGGTAVLTELVADADEAAKRAETLFGVYLLTGR
jgi:hypothetical protein